MQEIGQIAKKHTYKNKKGEEQQMKINVIPNNMENTWPSCWVNIWCSLIVSNS